VAHHMEGLRDCGPLRTHAGGHCQAFPLRRSKLR
jgi:hypothetical protein